MQITFLNRRQKQGSVLMTVMIIGGVIFIVTASILTLSSNSLQNAHGRVDWNKAYFNSENAMVWAAQRILDNPPAAGTSNYYSIANGSLTGNVIAPVNGDASFKGAWVQIVQPAGLPSDEYVITSSARVNDKFRTLQAAITAYPVSQVFDYEYFINNWGWWWGGSITGNGGQRSNWDFDFRDSPIVNGYIYAANEIDDNEVAIHIDDPSIPIRGLAEADPLEYLHAGAPRVVMPNLLDFSNYTAAALSNTSSNGIWIGSTQVVVGVQSNPIKHGIYLVGTAANPIVIKGTAVVPGDVVIQGVVTGQGTLYVGGDLYVAGNLQYANGPDYSVLPETLTPAQRDAWVANNQTKDLVAYAVNGSIFGGDVTSDDWYNYEMNYPGSGLNFVGDESQLGADGIANTGDDNIPFLHPDGSMSAWYDADGNGVVNHNYNFSNDVNMNNTRINNILGYPTNPNNGNPVPYSSVATDNIGHFDGIFYTDHAAAIRTAASSSVFNGSIISRNEQIVYNGSCQFIYDSRIHSRYHNNPNNLINLGLPYGKPIEVNALVELTPDRSNL
jgi:hypothetical protein